jgi:hypothetical protein
MHMYQNPDYYHNEDKKIKPQLIARVPYKFSANGLAPMDLFIELSPGLMFLKQQDALLICVGINNTQFYTDCERAYTTFKNTFSDNVAICNLVLFSEEFNKRAQQTTKETFQVVQGTGSKEGSKLRRLLNNLHEGEDPGSADILQFNWRDRNPKDE